MTLNLPLGPGTWWGIPRRCRPPDWGVSLWRWNHSTAGRYPVKDIFTLWMCISTASLISIIFMMVMKILIQYTFVNTDRNFFKYHRVFPMLLKKRTPLDGVSHQLWVGGAETRNKLGRREQSGLSGSVLLLKRWQWDSLLGLHTLSREFIGFSFIS